MDLSRMTREFLQNLEEGSAKVDIHGYIQALSETLNSISPRSQTEQRRMAVAKQHIKEIKKHMQVLQQITSQDAVRLKYGRMWYNAGKK